MMHLKRKINGNTISRSLLALAVATVVQLQGCSVMQLGDDGRGLAQCLRPSKIVT